MMALANGTAITQFALIAFAFAALVNAYVTRIFRS